MPGIMDRVSRIMRPAVAELRGNPLFAELTDGQLRRLAGHAELDFCGDGEILFSEGERATHFIVLLSGEVVLSKLVKGQVEMVARHSPGAAVPPDSRPGAADYFLGETAMLLDDASPVTATVVGPTRVARLDRHSFAAMLHSYPQLLQVMLPVVVWRVRAAEATAMQRAAVSAVSTFASGIAHELGNPLCAVRRSISELSLAMGRLAECAERWGAAGLPEERRLVGAAQRELTVPRCTLRTADALEVAGSAERMEAWLADRGVAEPAVLADLLAERGFSVAWLAALCGRLRTQAIAPALDHLAQSVLVHSLDVDLNGASQRLTDIVGTARQYAKLDRTPMRRLDLVADIEGTLAVLRHRLAGIQVSRDYAADLPPLLGYPAELNEVWTNIIDNAVAATGGAGRLRIATYRDGAGVAVEIGDDGAGIPAEALPRIFEPYFTTKDSGDGTGLGLFLSHLIVTERHGGSISVESRPGDTRFLVRLPLRPERPVGGRQGVIAAIIRGDDPATQQRRSA